MEQAQPLRKQWAKEITDEVPVIKPVLSLHDKACDVQKATEDVLVKHHQGRAKEKGPISQDKAVVSLLHDLRSVTHIICGLTEEVVKHSTYQQKEMEKESTWIPQEIKNLKKERGRIAGMNGYWNSRELHEEADALLLASAGMAAASKEAKHQQHRPGAGGAGGRRLGVLLTARALDRNVEDIRKRWLDWRQKTKSAYLSTLVKLRARSHMHETL